MVLPTELENLTYDQIFILCVEKKSLSLPTLVTTDQLRAMGVLPPAVKGQASLVQRIKARKAEEAARKARESRRDKKRRAAAELAAARQQGKA